MPERVKLLRRAYDLQITPIVATDVDVYLDMTLGDIAYEWNEDPVELLAVLSAVFVNSKDNGQTRLPNETFSDFVRRMLP